MKYITRVCALMTFVLLSASAQKIDSYMHDMGEALVPYGTLKGSNCHSVEIDLRGPWADFALLDGVNQEKPGQPTWTVLRVDVLRLFVDLSDLDEDKIQNQPIFSLEYISKHQPGTRYVADTPAVMMFTKGLNSEMKVHTVDRDKVDALRGQANVAESQMGVTLTERKYAFFLFSDQQHADAFQKAIQKAIVLCKAQ